MSKNADQVGQKGEHWYRLVSVFDGRGKQNVDINGQAYVLGRLDGQLFVKIPDNAPLQQRLALGALLEKHGYGDEVIIVPDYVQFARLERCSTQEVQMLKEHIAEQDAKAEAAKALAAKVLEEGPNAANPRP